MWLYNCWKRTQSSRRPNHTSISRDRIATLLLLFCHRRNLQCRFQLYICPLPSYRVSQGPRAAWEVRRVVCRLIHGITRYCSNSTHRAQSPTRCRGARNLSGDRQLNMSVYRAIPQLSRTCCNTRPNQSRTQHNTDPGTTEHTYISIEHKNIGDRGRETKECRTYSTALKRDSDTHACEWHRYPRFVTWWLVKRRGRWPVVRPLRTR